jgi:small-conductance mechanosensitive channel
MQATPLGFEHPLFDMTLFSIGGTSVSIATLVACVLIVLATIVLSAFLRRAAARALTLGGVAQESTIGLVQGLIHYVVLVTGFAVGLHTLGLNLSALFAAGAVFAIGIGFAMQNIAQNFVSGVILLAERSIKPGDIMEVDGRFVRVARMGIRATIARTLDEEEIIIPNATIVQSTVKNYTLKDSSFRLRASVGVVYGADMRLVRRTLERVAGEQTWRAAREPLVLMAEFGDSAVVWEASVWMDDPWLARRRRSELLEAVWWAFQEQGIVIAFPQLDVHLDEAGLGALKGLRSAS